MLRLHSNVQIHLNAAAATALPEWRGAVRPTRLGLSTSSIDKSLKMFWWSTRGLGLDTRKGIAWFPFGTALPLSFRGRGFSTIADTLERDRPTDTPRAERLFRLMARPLTIHATQIITSSRFAQSKLAHHYGVEASLVPPGISIPTVPDFSKTPDVEYVFYPANAWPHKNHLFLLETWVQHAELRRFALVFTMSTGAGALELPIASARKAGVDVRVLGHVTTAQVAGLYGRAICSVFPSLYEGYGLPVHESLGMNCPILLNSGAQALAECVNPSYPLLLPLVHSAWARAILEGPRNCPHIWPNEIRGRSWEESGRLLLNTLLA